MKIDVTKEIVNLRGATFKTGGVPCPQCGNIPGKAEDLTLRGAILQALRTRDKDDPDGKKSVERFHLALRIFDQDEPELTPEELVVIRKLIRRLFPVVVVGRCLGMLE